MYLFISWRTFHIFYATTYFLLYDIFGRHDVLSILFRSTGPIAVARRRSVGRSVDLSVYLSVCLSVCLSVNICNSATYVRIFLKIGGNIPWVNITKSFFVFVQFWIFYKIFLI